MDTREVYVRGRKRFVKVYVTLYPCTECGGPVKTARRHKTICSAKCRMARSRRLAAEEKTRRKKRKGKTPTGGKPR